MDEDWTVPGWAVLVTLAVLLLLVTVVLRVRARTAAALDASRREAAALSERLDALERRPAAEHARVDETEYVVTMLGREDEDDVAEGSDDPAESGRVVPAPLFADLVLREGVVQAASLAAGLRRALAPEMRHRIRFEMKREVKRARKQRRADLRQAKREFEARQRAATSPGAEAA